MITSALAELSQIATTSHYFLRSNAAVISVAARQLTPIGLIFQHTTYLTICWACWASVFTLKYITHWPRILMDAVPSLLSCRAVALENVVYTVVYTVVLTDVFDGTCL